MTIARFAAAGLALVALTGTAMSASKDDTISTAKGALEIHAIHHASLMLSWNGKTVLIDPAPLDEGDTGAEFKALPKPDVIVFTHGHYDHYNAHIALAIAGSATEILAPQDVYDAMPSALKIKTKMMRSGDTASADGIPVEAVAMYNITPEREKFHPKGHGNGYILTFGGKRIYIAGDTEEAPELAHLEDIDAAFLPMNLPYTQSIDAAAHWVRDFKPRIVYPYHFRNGDGTRSDLDKFKAEVAGTSEVRVLEWY